MNNDCSNPNNVMPVFLIRRFYPQEGCKMYRRTISAALKVHQTRWKLDIPDHSEPPHMAL